MEPVIGATYRLVLGAVLYKVVKVSPEGVVTLEGPGFGASSKVRVVKHVPLGVFRERYERVAG